MSIEKILANISFKNFSVSVKSKNIWTRWISSFKRYNECRHLTDNVEILPTRYTFLLILCRKIGLKTNGYRIIMSKPPGIEVWGNISFLFKKITCWLRLNLRTCQLNDYPLIRGMTSVITWPTPWTSYLLAVLFF